MQREREIYRKIFLFAMVGLSLAGLAIFAPNAAPAHGESFIRVADESHWAPRSTGRPSGAASKSFC